ncbi:hypothetical protein ASPWEDRAFT_740153 [Aspergillus wentii DTO 134E9]|uniref:Uncharacterized protein n=1 Tax=Aspergillus wentii DTO 134E9 TaxID=1073089 RepID=A0A1L9RK51_ASPWE|nr:uncharacterized protein ASPWEDRAFT_740153 [Aspergillus wentii DTO 134E9]KAI9923480.1 hypothetical protein MW887_008641 [Aspergillus wentii]OJJ35312.1 hypothetical protein ASPWEDRAFT_740153 [Aspergillus wentii DTO 134E9]
MSKFRSQRKRSPSISDDDAWKVDHPFGPPRTSSFAGGGIRRLRDTLSKLSPSSLAEKELLKEQNRYKIPLTERNVDTFVTEQECTDACYPDQHSRELTVSAWLERLS